MGNSWLPAYWKQRSWQIQLQRNYSSNQQQTGGNFSSEKRSHNKVRKILGSDKWISLWEALRLVTSLIVLASSCTFPPEGQVNTQGQAHDTFFRLFLSPRDGWRQVYRGDQPSPLPSLCNSFFSCRLMFPASLCPLSSQSSCYLFSDKPCRYLTCRPECLCILCLGALLGHSRSDCRVHSLQGSSCSTHIPRNTSRATQPTCLVDAHF